MHSGEESLPHFKVLPIDRMGNTESAEIVIKVLEQLALEVGKLRPRCYSGIEYDSGFEEAKTKILETINTNEKLLKIAYNKT